MGLFTMRMELSAGIANMRNNKRLGTAPLHVDHKKKSHLTVLARKKKIAFSSCHRALSAALI